MRPVFRRMHKKWENWQIERVEFIGVKNGCLKMLPRATAWWLVVLEAVDRMKRSLPAFVRRFNYTLV